MYNQQILSLCNFAFLIIHFIFQQFPNKNLHSTPAFQCRRNKKIPDSIILAVVLFLTVKQITDKTFRVEYLTDEDGNTYEMEVDD